MSGWYSPAHAETVAGAEIGRTGATRSLGNRTRASLSNRVFGILGRRRSKFAVIWDEPASFSAPIGHDNVSGMYGLDLYVLYPHVCVASPNKHENLGCAEIPATSWSSPKIALSSLQRFDNMAGSVVLTLTDRGRFDYLF